MSMENKAVISAIGALALVSSATAATKPNILIIVVDDMGYSDLGCFGGEISTPNIDKLADQGVRFTQFYSNPMSAPTRASLLTGLYPTNAGIGNMGLETTVKEYQNYLRHDCATVAEIFKHAGYYTYQSGKWHVGQDEGQKPVERGFDKGFTMIGGATDYYEPLGMYLNNEPWKAPEGYYMTHAVTEKAVEFIHEVRDAPFLMYLAYNAPHWPLQAPQEDIDKYKGRYDQGWDVIRKERFERMKKMGVLSEDAVLSPPDESAGRWKWDALSAEEKKRWAGYMEIYAAMIDVVDQGVGQVIDALEKQGVLDDTIILFMSDNGSCAEDRAKVYIKGVDKDAPPTVAGSTIVYKAPWANVSATPHWKYKSSSFNGGINVPLIVRYPQVVKRQGGFNRSAAHVMDVLPTLLDLTSTERLTYMGGQKMQDLDGVSMKSLLKGGSKPIHDYICWEHRGKCAILKGNWKMVFDNSNQQWKLYDLTRHGGVEVEDLSARNPQKVEELLADYKEWMKENKVIPFTEQLKLPKRNKQ